MLSENIKTFRKSKGLSQEELADVLHVVRQTVSKWETGLSVPDSDMLIALSEALGVSVSVLLGETVEERSPDEIKVISEKLEAINLLLARRKQKSRRCLHLTFIIVGAAVVTALICLFLLGSPYLNWDYGDPQTAVIGTAFHIFEFVFVRASPFILIGTVIGAVLTAKKQ